MFFYSFDFALIVNVPIPVIDSVAKRSGFIVVSFRNKVESAFLFWVWMSVKTNVLNDDGLPFYPCFGHRGLRGNQNVPPFRLGLLVDIGVMLPFLVITKFADSHWLFSCFLLFAADAVLIGFADQLGVVAVPLGKVDGPFGLLAAVGGDGGEGIVGMAMAITVLLFQTMAPFEGEPRASENPAGLLFGDDVVLDVDGFLFAALLDVVGLRHRDVLAFLGENADALPRSFLRCSHRYFLPFLAGFLAGFSSILEYSLPMRCL